MLRGPEKRHPPGSNVTTGGEAGEIVIGGLAPLTGDVSVYGIATNNGAQLAVKQANEAGKNIKYVSYDEKGDATEAVNAYNKLVENDKIVALVGDVTSKPTQAVAQQAVKDNMPMITEPARLPILRQSARMCSAPALSTRSRVKLWQTMPLQSWA